MKNINLKQYSIRSALQVIILAILLVFIIIIGNSEDLFLENIFSYLDYYLSATIISAIILLPVKVFKFLLILITNNIKEDSKYAYASFYYNRVSAQAFQFVIELTFAMFVFFLLLILNRYLLIQGIISDNIEIWIMVLIAYFSPMIYISIFKKMYGYKLYSFEVVKLDGSKLSRFNWLVRMIVKTFFYPSVITVMGLIGLLLFALPLTITKAERDIVDLIAKTKISKI